MKATIYHNPKCSKSIAALEMLEKYNIDIDTKLYIDRGLTRAEFYDILELTGSNIVDLIRLEEQVFLDKYCVSGIFLSKESFINAIVEDPILLERPIVLFKQKGIGALVRSEEAILKLFKKVGIGLDEPQNL